MTTLSQRALFGAALLLAAGCDAVDQARPDEAYCSSGASVLTVDDSAASADLREAVYSPGGAIHTGHPDYNARGTLVVVPASFPNYPANPEVTESVIRQAFFEAGTGSVRDYFFEQSWGQFALSEGDIAPSVPLAKTPEQYSASDFTRSSEVKKDILQGAILDWPALDLDGDRTITPDEAQFLFLVPLGGGGANRPDDVSVQTQYGTYRVRNSFVWADSRPAGHPAQGVATIGYNYPVIWHELAHGLFAMPDRYGTFSGTGLTGEYDIMSDNFSNIGMNAADKMRIGWVRPRILVKGAEGVDARCYSFAAAEGQPAVLAVYEPGAPNDLWVVEYRKRTASPRGFDADLPEDGLAVWWVNLSDPARDEIRLVDASDSSRLPTDYKDQTSGALFARARSLSPDEDRAHLLRGRSSSRSPVFVRVRGLSSADGQTMYAEF